jgi:spore coat protein U-like protein
MISLRTLGALALLAVIPLAAWATPPSVAGTSPVSSQTVNSCILTTLDSLTFGSYNPTSTTPSMATGSVGLRCTKAAVYAVTADGGLTRGNRMVSGGNSLAYELFTDSAFSKPWGTGVTVGTLAAFIGAGQTACINANVSSPTLPANATLAYYSGGLYYAQLVGISPRGCSAFGTTGFQLSGGIPAYYGVPSGTPQSNFAIIPHGNTGNSLSGAATSAMAAIVLPYYGRVPANQDVIPGAYSDQVTVTVSF